MWHGQKAFDSLRFQTGHTVDHVTTRRHSLHRGKCCLWDATPSREERTPGGGCKGCRTSSSLSLVVSHRSLCQYLATANFESPLFTGLLLNSVRRETGTPGKYGKHRMKARRCSKIAGTSQRTLQTACDSTEPPGLKILEHSSPVLFENSNLQPFRALPPNARCCLSSKDRTTTEQSVACPNFGKPGVERR